MHDKDTKIVEPPTRQAFDRIVAHNRALVAERQERHASMLELAGAVGEFLEAYFAPERRGPNPPVKSGERIAHAIHRLGEIVPVDLPERAPVQLSLTDQKATA